MRVDITEKEWAMICRTRDGLVSAGTVTDKSPENFGEAAQFDPRNQLVGGEAKQASVGSMLIQKAIAMRRQADALNKLGNQVQQMEIRKGLEDSSSRDMIEALSTVLR